MTPEQQARQEIDALLEKTGWMVQGPCSVNLYAGSGSGVETQAGKYPDAGGSLSGSAGTPTRYTYYELTRRD